MKSGFDPFDATLEPTAELWRRLARPFDLPLTVNSMFGLSVEVVQRLAAIHTCTGREAKALLKSMPSILRNLRTAVGADIERCYGSVRGPVQWSATIAAQASSMGNRDVYVCASPRRAYDIDENRVLVAALQAIVDAGQMAGGSFDILGEDEAIHLARTNARSARRYLDHRSLDAIPVEPRPSRRTVRRARSGKSAATYRPAVAMFERSTEPLSLEELGPYCDHRTRVQHGVILAVLDELEARGMTVPAPRAESGSLFAGPVEYVHPRGGEQQAGTHGIFIGNMLVDVPLDPDDHDRARVEAELSRRAGQRPVFAVLTRSDISAAVDRAIVAARTD